MEFALIPAAFLAGLLMFLAPCTLPLVPGYLAFISGVPETAGISARRKILINAISFVVGFSMLFIALGASAGFLGSIVGPWRDILGRGAGIIFIIFGLTLLEITRIPFLSGEFRIRLPKFLSIGRPESSFLIGALFALGWSPCIGPILASILFLASGSATALQGAFLLAVFSLGFSLPFIGVALFISRAQRMIDKIGYAARILSRTGGVILILLGLLMAFGQMGLLVTWGFRFLEWPYTQLLNYM